MTHTLSPERLAHTEAALAVHAPELLDGFLAAVPEAADTVGRRLRGALTREGLRDMGPGAEHGYGRVEYATSGVGDPVHLLDGMDAPAFAAEIRNAVVNLAIAMARPPAPAGDDPARDDPARDDPDWQAVALERLAVAGHNLHPCGRTRLGWDVSDVLAHDLEAPATRLGFVAVRDDLYLGDDVFPELPAPPGYRVQPVHAWQRDTILPARYADLLHDGALRILDHEIDAVPTGALRTLLLPGTGEYLKVSLDIQVTSTRRSISVASTRNGPALSRLLHTLVEDDRLLLLDETAGSAVPVGSGRDLSAIRRTGLTGRLEPGERAIPGGALPFLLGDLVTGDPGDWLRAYAEMLLPPLLRLTGQGVALEAHLQNCLPTFVDGRPHRLALRDFAGLRVHLPRLAEAGHHITLWPGSVVGTDDLDVLRAKIGYTLFQAHLGEIVLHLPIEEHRAWRIIRDVLDTCATGDDHAAFTAPRVPHKALVRMRLAGQGDLHVPVPNPLHAR
ncbi:IucA/IucC family protein [Paractinoplanes rishiriensis]|uniref:Iron transporter n=1 Tax=Paractinoplanes rishiriensis TaxID=1050105 RepID=A0A919K4Q5_9ACTN|nr:IucA/IucC family protein [Actinoplanes rishiriensis]GIE98802.1 iron transporter [Actinoplanes rishiriensis]